MTDNKVGGRGINHKGEAKKSNRNNVDGMAHKEKGKGFCYLGL